MGKSQYKLIFIGIVFLLLAAGSVRAQSGLGFSQVLLVTAAEDTVPPGKVWKISGVLPQDMFTFGSNNAPLIFRIIVNGNTRSWGHSAFTDSNQNSSIPTGNVGTIWLPAGTRLRAGTNVAEISVLEFTVIP